MFTSHITASEMFKYTRKCFIVRPPFLHWLLPSFLYNICLFPPFPSCFHIYSGLCHRVLFLTSFIWLHIDPFFSLKLHQGHPSPPFLSSRPVFLQVLKIFNIQWYHRTTPCGTLPLITFQLSENEHQRPPWRRKEKEELSQKGSLRPGEKIEIRTVSAQAVSSKCTGKSPFAKFSSCSYVVIPYAKILYSPTVLPIHCRYFRVDLEKSKWERS